MRAILTTAAVAAAMALGAGGAAARPAVPRTPSCVGLSGTPAAARVWWGRFSGGREEVYSGGFQAPVGVSTEGCFATERACRRWLYQMKGAYSALPPVSGTGCRLGYRGTF